MHIAQKPNQSKEVIKKQIVHNPWLYNNEPFEMADKKYEGFVYLITDIETGKKYIGKKSFKSKRMQKKTQRRKTLESDWKTYYSSNDFIKNTAKKEPLRFKREILRLCLTKGEINFYEIEEQFKRDVLKSDEYYNFQILGKYFKQNVLEYQKNNQVTILSIKN